MFRRPKWWRKPVIYRFARAAHSYLSAFAFIGLMFFAATGFLLNHPEWLKGSEPTETVTDVQLSLENVSAQVEAADPGLAFAHLLTSEAKVQGYYTSAEVFEEEAFLRFSGVKGDSTVFIDLTTGEAVIETSAAPAMSVIRELHRGKDAGAVWRLLIDALAIFTLLLSSIGFFLFFTMKFRLQTSLRLTGASLFLFVGVFIACVR